jgi:glycosyltransferase involved in cell wall biosynthesis
VKSKFVFIHLGPFLSNFDIEKNPFLSAASSKWQKNWIDSLLPLSKEYFVFSYLPNPYFPKGKLRPKQTNTPISNFRIYYINYINIIFLRELSLFFSILKTFFNLKVTPKILVTYNSSNHNIFVGQILKYLKNIYWINIVADDEGCIYANKNICLSYWSFLNLNIPDKIFFPGFIEKPIVSDYSKNGNLKLVYCGAINQWTGIINFVNNFSSLHLLNIELHIYGTSSPSFLDFINNLDSKNIFYHGFVPDSQLEKEMQSAFAFINPRPTNLKDSEKNFPSKVLFYLKFLKPIISTSTGGLSKEFEDLFYIYKNDDIISLKKIINIVCDLDENSYTLLREKYIALSKKYSTSNAENLFLYSVEIEN